MISGIEGSVIVVLASERLLGVFDKISEPDSISESILDGHPGRRDGLVRVVMPGKGIPMPNCKQRHLETDDCILNCCSKVVGGVSRYIAGDGTQKLQYREEEALPIGSENDELDTQKLGHGSEGLEVPVHADPEHGQRVQAEGDADVVYYTRPEIARVNIDIAFLVCVGQLENDGSHGKYRLEVSILQNPSFNRHESMGIRYINFVEVETQRPRMSDWRPSVHHDDERPFPTEEVDQELQESVDGEGFVDIAQWVEVEGGLERHHRCPRGGCVDGNHEEDPHDIALKKWLPIVWRGQSWIRQVEGDHFRQRR